jgi:tRNA (cmo5U34)-methyltransferase
MNSATQHAFDTTAASYDADRSKLIPGFDSFYRWAVDLVPHTSLSIVDLGAGTGLLSAFLRTRFPYAQLHLVDLSEPMLQHARTRFAGQLHVTFQVADYQTAALPPGADAIVSALSIHHLHDEAKRSLFQRIYRSLSPGGVFINADQTLGPTPALESIYQSTWLAQVRSLGATEQQIALSLFRQREDRCAPVHDQLAWMREAGFADVDCWFKDGRFAVLAGTKPAPAGD